MVGVLKKASIAILILVLWIVTWRWAPVLLARLPLSTAEELELTWQECRLNDGYGGWQQASQCFGHPEPMVGDEGKVRHGKRMDMEHFRLETGQDTYETNRIASLLFYDLYALTKNSWPISLLAGEFLVHSPNIGLYEIGGKIAWEFADDNTATIIYDGQDVRRTYGIDKAYRPYRVGDGLISIGQKGGRYFVVYNGKKLTPEFDEVVIAYCCEAVMYSPQGRQGIYLFNGTRDGQNYLIEIKAMNQ